MLCTYRFVFLCWLEQVELQIPTLFCFFTACFNIKNRILHCTSSWGSILPSCLEWRRKANKTRRSCSFLPTRLGFARDPLDSLYRSDYWIYHLKINKNVLQEHVTVQTDLELLQNEPSALWAKHTRKAGFLSQSKECLSEELPVYFPAQTEAGYSCKSKSQCKHKCTFTNAHLRTCGSMS